MLKRLFDIIFASLFIFLTWPLFLLIFLGIKLTSKGPAIFWSERIGYNNKPFYMPKFRTMFIQTPEVASNDLQNPKDCITPIGRFLRKASLDEIPQIWSVLVGNMSLVGPRPVIAAERELVRLRIEKNIYSIKPGITGWAQINGRDFMTIEKKVEFDDYYLKNRSFILDLQIIAKTSKKVIKATDIIH